MNSQGVWRSLAVGCAVVAAISAVALAGLLLTYMPGWTPLHLMTMMQVSMTLGVLLLLFLAVIGVVFAIIHFATGRRADGLSWALRIVGSASVALGLLMALHGFTAMQTAIAEVGPVRFAVTSSSWAKIALFFALGFGPAAIWFWVSRPRL